MTGNVVWPTYREEALMEMSSPDLSPATPILAGSCDEDWAAAECER